MLLLWILVLLVGIAYLAHRRMAPLPALGIVAVYLSWQWARSVARRAGCCWFSGY
jgi:hypothetical protein